MRALRALIPSVFLLVMLLAPLAAFAAPTDFFGPLLPVVCHCEEQGSAPDWGCVWLTLQNILNFAMSLGVLIFVLTAAYAGILFMTSPVHPQNRELGRSVLLNAVVGLLLALSAWLMVDFIMGALYNPSKGFGPWNAILTANSDALCLKKNEAPVADTTEGGGGDAQGGGSGGSATSSNTPSGSATCSNCISATISHKPPPNGCDLNGGNDGVGAPNPSIMECQMNSTLHSKLVAARNVVGGWWVTEMWPPTRDHEELCHTNGECVDIAFMNGPDNTNGQKVLAVINAVQGQGLDAIFEAKSQAHCNELVAEGVPAGEMEIVPGQDGSGHFSVYRSSRSADGCGN
ncbi:MAG: pilin [Minisyncoccia bacterium]